MCSSDLSEVDRRHSRRYEVDLPCRLTVAGHGALNARVIDLSQGGARIQGVANVPAGARGTLNLDGLGTVLPFTVRDVDGEVLGVALELDQMATAALGSMLERLAPRRAA